MSTSPEPQAPAATKDATPPVRRRWIPTILIVLATVVLFLDVFALWINRQALDTENWGETSTELLESPAIQTQVATYMVDQLFANVDVEAELREALPPEAAALAGPAAGGLRNLAQNTAERALQNPRFQQLWLQANLFAHSQLLAILNDELANVSTADGTVTLDVSTLVAGVAEQIGVGERLASKLPPDAAQLEILQSDQLSTAQSIAKALDGLPVVLAAIALALFALAIYLSPGRRREMLRTVGFSFIAAGLLALVARNLAGDAMVNSLAKTAAAEPAVADVWDIGSSLLRTTAMGGVVNGLLIVIGAWLAGPTRLATAGRRVAAPFLEHRLAVSYAVLFAIYVLLVAWAPTPAFHDPASLILVAVLFVIGMEALRRQTAREFPDTDAEHASVNVREGLTMARGAVERSVGAARSAAKGRGDQPADPADDTLARLERLQLLRAQGVLSEEEFAAQKAAALGPPP